MSDANKPKRNALTAKQAFDLMNYIQFSYAQSRVDDCAFAAMATERLGFPVTGAMLHNYRSQLEIPNNRVVLAEERKAKEEADRAATPTTVLARLDRLESALLDLIKVVKKLDARGG